MSTSEDEIDCSYEVFVKLLHEISSHDQETKQAAQKKIQALEIQATDEFGIHLVDYLVQSAHPVEVRQVAAWTLNQYIETHWSSTFERFQSPEIELESKIKIKESLPRALQSVFKVRIAVADSICAIARSDWPENWSALFDTIISYLSNPNAYTIWGALEVLNGLTQKLTDTQVPNFAPVILREMGKILEAGDYWADYTRSMAVANISQMVTTISAHKQPGLIEQYLQPSIKIFCAEFIKTDLTKYAQLGCQIVKAIRVLTIKLPKSILDFLPKLLALIWKTLIDSAKIYQESTVNWTENINDEDTKATKLNNQLVITVFEFISTLMSGSNGNTLVLPEYKLLDYHWFYLQDSLPPEVIHHLIIFVQITNEQIEQWTDNTDQFIMEENITKDSSFSHSIRGKAQKLLMKIVHRPERAAANALCNEMLKQIEAGNVMRNSTNSGVNNNWWKLHEAVIQVFGLIKGVLHEKQQAGTLSFDVAAFLKNVVLVNLNNSESHQLLVARCVYIGGLYADQMPLEMRSLFLEATINSLKNQPACAVIWATKAANCWLSAASCNGKNSDSGSILKFHLSALFQELFNVGNQLMSAEVLAIVLENFATLASIDKAFTASVRNEICTLAIAAFVNFPSNCLVFGICQKVFKELMLNPECVELLQTYLVPILVGRLTVNPLKKPEHEEVQVDTLEVLMLLVQHSPQPLSNFLIKSAFPATCQFILSSDKYCDLLKAGKVIRTYLSAAADQVIVYRDNDGKTGPQYILRIATHLLNHDTSDLLAEDACEIMTSLIRKASNPLGENVDQLLSALFSRLQCIEIRARVQKLLMVYAHLVNTEFEAVFNFLSTAEGPNEQCALGFIISDGFCREHKSFDQDDRRTVTLALSKILEHSVTHQDSKLHEINFHETEGDAESTIPLLLKVSKLISNELFLDTFKSS